MGDDASSVTPAAEPLRAVSALPPETAAALEAMEAALSVISGLDRSVLDGRQAAQITQRLAAVASRSAAVGAYLLPVVEADGLWSAGGARSFPIWVASEHNLGVQAARAQVRLGRALRDHLPLTARAATDGVITAEHAKVLAQLTPTTEQRRQVLADPAHPCNEAFLVEQARQLSVDDLRLVARRWAAYTDPDADDRGYVEACEREHLQVARVGDMYEVTGQLTVDTGQTLKAALAAVTPVRAPDDDRSAGQRRANALGDLARIALDHAQADRGRTVRPRINVLVDHVTFTALLASACARRGVQGALPTGALPGGPVRSPSFATPGIVTGAALAGGPQYEDGTPISRACLELLACDSGIARVVFGPSSEVLDVGRAQRTFTGPRREALIARDKHCRYPGCTAPPILCDGHHIDQWARDHGETAVRTGILLCTFHHGHVHRRQVEITRDRGRFVFSDRHGREITGEHHTWPARE